MTKEELEIQKLEREIEALKLDAATRRRTEIRGWITAISIISGIVISVYGAYQTLVSIRAKDQQLAIESSFRTKELMVNITARLTGEGTVVYHYDRSGALTGTDKQLQMRSSQLAAYDTALVLGNDSPPLRPLITNILLRQICQAGDEFPEEEELRKTLEKLGWRGSNPRHDPADRTTFCAAKPTPGKNGN